jgi:GMP synthase (glutamine-hydrolysing)
MFVEGLSADSAHGEIVVETLDVRELSEDAPLPALSSFDGVSVTGSPAMVGEDAGWMRWSVRAIKRTLELGVPFFGVCFGHQLLGVALGADVGPNPRGREMGSVFVDLTPDDDDPLLSSLPRKLEVMVTHVDVIRNPGPKLRVHGTAPHDPCHVVRAGPLAWGVQFHPELDEESMKTYLYERRHMLESDHGHGAADERLVRLGSAELAGSLLSRFARVCADHRRDRAEEGAVHA